MSFVVVCCASARCFVFCFGEEVVVMLGCLAVVVFR